MTTFYVRDRKGHLALTTHDKARAEQLASALDGSVQMVEREPTTGERLAWAA